MAALIDLRKREESEADGNKIRALRQRFIDRTEEQAKKLATVKTELERKVVVDAFNSEMRDDYKELRDALKVKSVEILGTKEILIAISGAIGAALPAYHTFGEVLTVGGALTAVGGLLAVWSKFVQERMKTLKEHPMAYWYEVVGGLRY